MIRSAADQAMPLLLYDEPTAGLDPWRAPGLRT